MNTSIKPTSPFPKSECKRTLLSEKGRQKNTLRKPTTNKPATSIKQDSHAPEHTHNSPSPHPPSAPVETNEITPSSTCLVLSFKVPPVRFILHVTSKLPAHYPIIRGRTPAGRIPAGSFAHGGTLHSPVTSTHLLR